MIIHLWTQEMMLLKKYADEFKKKTGVEYSLNHIMSILREKYEENLDKDLREVMDIKVRELKEAEAGEEVNKTRRSEKQQFKPDRVRTRVRIIQAERSNMISGNCSALITVPSNDADGRGAKSDIQQRD